jgi:BirA family transcriptional regulator, biotin operon repressor / biotin---[acetyl-CoA-carboxylase] ligase
MSGAASFPARLRARLAAGGEEWPADIEHLPAVGSTNEDLKLRARAGAAAWTVVIADAQTTGRGRQGRRWSSPVGNLYMSVLLRPEPRGARWSVLPLAAGLAVAEALAALGLDPRLKWPNDVLVGGRKIAGLLAEATSGADGVESVVLGIGVNVGVRPGDLPADMAAGVTCVEEEGRTSVDRVEVAAAVLARLSVWYHALAREGPRTVQSAWRDRAVPWWGRTVEARSGERRLRGIARDLDEGGALVIELEDGTRALLHSGDVHEVRPARD